MSYASHISFKIKKHLHIRGENVKSRNGRCLDRETPPHTWRKSPRRGRRKASTGNTSTYVEKMPRLKRRTSGTWKHLHIRGENWGAKQGLSVLVETPPHTWRKSSGSLPIRGVKRNTSTYVEKMNLEDFDHDTTQKHLHIRGENHIGYGSTLPHEETPPHTWRKLNRQSGLFFQFGNTSTYVEKMASIFLITASQGKHLHIRGENPSPVSS